MRYSFVASLTIRTAFWLESTGLHLWAVNASVISINRSTSKDLLDLNWALQRSHTPMAGGGALLNDPQVSLGHDRSLAHLAIDRLPWGKAETRHQFVTKTTLFKGYFERFENWKSKGAKGFLGVTPQN